MPPIPTEAKLNSRGEAALRFVWLAQYLAMFALFFAALAQWRRYPAQLQLLCLSLLVYALLHTPFTVGSRYRLPVMLLVAIGGGLGSVPVFRKLAASGLLQARPLGAAASTEPGPLPPRHGQGRKAAAPPATGSIG